MKGKAYQKTYDVDMEPNVFRQYLRFIYNPFLKYDSELFAKLVNIEQEAFQAAYLGIDRENRGDLLLISEDKVKFSVHKCVLIARMDYFKAMFSHQWQEKQLKEVQIQADSTILSAFIDVMYTGTSGFFDNYNLDVLALALKKADEYLYGYFKSLVEDRLKRIVNFRNAPKIFPIASQYYATELLKYLQQFIVLNLNAFLEARWDCFRFGNV